VCKFVVFCWCRSSLLVGSIACTVSTHANPCYWLYRERARDDMRFALRDLRQELDDLEDSAALIERYIQTGMKGPSEVMWEAFTREKEETAMKEKDAIEQSIDRNRELIGDLQGTLRILDKAAEAGPWQ